MVREFELPSELFFEAHLSLKGFFKILGTILSSSLEFLEGCY